MYICFVDYEKAFDRMNLIKLMEITILQKIKIDWRDQIDLEPIHNGHAAYGLEMAIQVLVVLVDV